jgi:hypothetical protein
MSIAAGPGCCGDRFKTCKPQFGQHVVGHIRQAGVIGGQRATSTRRGLDYPGALIDTILPTGPQRPLRWSTDIGVGSSASRTVPHCSKAVPDDLVYLIIARGRKIISPQITTAKANKARCGTDHG